MKKVDTKKFHLNFSIYYRGKWGERGRRNGEGEPGRGKGEGERDRERERERDRDRDRERDRERDRFDCLAYSASLL